MKSEKRFTGICHTSSCHIGTHIDLNWHFARSRCCCILFFSRCLCCMHKEGLETCNIRRFEDSTPHKWIAGTGDVAKHGTNMFCKLGWEIEYACMKPFSWRCLLWHTVKAVHNLVW